MSHHPFTPKCPVCGSTTVQVYDKNERRLFACNKCQTDVIVPISAWTVAAERKSDTPES
jgi:endogenous inhibitor of DNA gyrase (YacG/DUF329 family)